MKSGDMVYYRLSDQNVLDINVEANVKAGELYPALVIRAYSVSERVSSEETNDTYWADKSFSGVCDIRVLLPGIGNDLWVPEAEHDDYPVQEVKPLHPGPVNVLPGLGKFMTVQPTDLI